MRIKHIVPATAQLVSPQLNVGAGLMLAAVLVPVLLMATGSRDVVAARLPGV